MSRLLVVLLIIAIIAIIWYFQRERARAAELHRMENARRLQASARSTERMPLTASTVDTERAPAGGRLQEAAERAAGRGYEQATGQLEEMTADLAAARQQADFAAARLSRQAEDTLAAVQAAAASYGGAVPGDGTHDCPPGYPIKGSISSMRFFEPGADDYEQTIPEVCFQNVAAADAAGFSVAGAEAVDVEEIAVVDVDAASGSDVVANAIAAADAGGVPPGAIRGDGGRDCPPAYPIKGNQSSMLYHEPGTATYESTIPEFCFSSIESATAAGFAATRF